MSSIRLDIVTAERVVYSEEVEVVIAPGVEGQLGILPHHAPLMTTLQVGELLARKGGEEFSMVISGGFLEVRPDRVIVLADVAERAEEIDLARAEEAKRRAEERLSRYAPEVDMARAEAALRRSLIRIKVGEKRRRRQANIRPSDR
ncbi:F0F1 ATP synthase subunit epsilon [Chloroflexota bacterium]